MLKSTLFLDDLKLFFLVLIEMMILLLMCSLSTFIFI